MQPETFFVLFNVAILGSCVVVLGWLAWSGALSERTLRLGPTRDPGFPPSLFYAGAALSIGYVGAVFVARESNSVWVQLLAEVLPFAIIGLMLGRCMHVLGGFRIVGLVPRHLKRDLKWCAVAVPVALLFQWASGIVMVMLSQYFGWHVDSGGHDTLVFLLDGFTVSKLLFVLFFAAVMAPLMEELLFRGVMQTSLLHVFGQWRWLALGYTAVLFSLTHAWVVPWQNLVPLFVLGLVFGYVYERTGSLLVPVLTHAGFNAVNVGLALVMPQPGA